MQPVELKQICLSSLQHDIQKVIEVRRDSFKGFFVNVPGIGQ